MVKKYLLIGGCTFHFFLIIMEEFIIVKITYPILFLLFYTQQVAKYSPYPYLFYILYDRTIPGKF